MDDFNNIQNNIPSAPPTPPQAPVENTPVNPAAPIQPAAPEQPQAPVQQPQQPEIPVQPVQHPTPPIQQPVPPVQPPQQPQVPVQQPAPPVQPQQTVYQQPPQPDFNSQPYYQQPVHNQAPDNYYNPNYAYIPKAPVKQPMSGPVKAFVAITFAILGASLIAFIAFLGMSSENSSTFTTTPSEDYRFTMPSQEYDYTQPDTSLNSDKNYEKSDAQKETEPNFAGIKQSKKPGKKAESGTQYAFNKMEKSVVGIICYTDEQEGTSTSYSSMGSGIIVTSNGYIVTNAHIINNSRTSYLLKVITSDKKTYDAGVVGYDSRYDLAVLKIDAKNLPVAEFGKSSELNIAEDVIAIGNPKSINYQNSVTKGIVSALNREASITNNAKFIQTDTPINPGNSGGPLCNMYGQVVGITTSKIALEDYEGMGFAIPSDTAKSVADSIIKYSYVKNRVKIGIVGEITSKEADGANGIKIQEISKGGPMDNTGAQSGDIITKVDGENITTFAEVYNVLEKHKTGDKVKVTLYRPSTEKTYDVTVTLQEDKQ